MRPSASWAIDSEPIRARRIIVKYSVWHERFARVYSLGMAIFCVSLRELVFAIRTNCFFLLGINFCDFFKVPGTQH